MITSAVLLDDCDDVVVAAPTGVLLSDVRPERVSWLWYGRIPLGKLTVLDGDPGLGKSTLSLDLAARVSRGLPMPGETDAVAPAGVVLLSGEDDLADTIRPRLDAAGADVSRIVALRTVPGVDEDRPPTLDDLDYIRAAIARVDAALVIVDPIMAFLADETDSHKDQSMRRVLHRLAMLAEDEHAAVVVVRHLNKSSGGNPLYRGGGSIGIIGAARAGFVVGRDPDDPNRRVLACQKSNLAAEPPSLAFHIEQYEYTSRVVFDGVSIHTASMILAEPSDEDERTAVDEARDFLRDVLTEQGSMSAKDVYRQADDAGISKRTLDRAKKALRVESHKTQYRWEWRLPKDATPSYPDNLGNLGNLDTSPQVNGSNQDCQQGCQPPKIAKIATLPAPCARGDLDRIPFDEVPVEDIEEVMP